MTRLHVADYVGTIESVDFKAFKFLLDCGGTKHEFSCDPIEMIFLIEPVWDVHPCVRVRGASLPGTPVVRFQSIEAAACPDPAPAVPAGVPASAGASI